jgi:hypothetical protein
MLSICTLRTTVKPAACKQHHRSIQSLLLCAQHALFDQASCHATSVQQCKRRHLLQLLPRLAGCAAGAAAAG